MEILLITLFVLTAVSCAAQDIIKSFDKSIFSKINRYYKLYDWLKSDWTYKYIDGDPWRGIKKLFGIIRMPAFLYDGWHFFNSLKLTCFFWIAILLIAFPIELSFLNGFWSLLIFFIAAKLIWGFIFELFYGIIFRLPSDWQFYTERFWKIF